MLLLAGDINGHAGISNVGYDGTRGGFGYGLQTDHDPGVHRWAKPSYLQHCVHEAGIQAGDITQT